LSSKAAGAKPTAETRQVKVVEGTNIAAAAAPDGKSVAFDLFGVMWTVPVTGGPATRITDDLTDGAQPDWTPDLREYAEVWRRMPKWVVSRTLNSVGPNATLIADDVGAAVRGVKERLDGLVEVAGTKLAGSLTDLGLIDEYQLYMRPFVLGGGTPYFVGPRPPLHLVANELIGEDAVRLSYVPA
jgi:hypothetical protein